MITHLSYHVRFRQTQRVLANSLDFGQGMTAIVGPNEAGKSFVVEMIRYAFFGSAALRGVAEDYEELRVKLIWKDYEIFRHPKGGTIKRGGEVIATGTKPLNAKVIEVLGFGLDVFDIACVCNQGDVERLGAMTPTERKAMVDRVIGAAKIEEVQKFAAEQQSLLVREIAVLERGLVEPVEPARPAYDGPTSELRAEVARLRGLKTEHDQLVGWLSATRAAPVEPAFVNGTEPDLRRALDEARAHEAECKRVRALPIVDFDVDAVAREWEASDLWTERVNFERTHPRPTITTGYYVEQEAERERFDKVTELLKLKAKATAHELTCPHCQKGFHLEHATVVKIDQQLNELGPALDCMTRAELDDQRRRLADWSDTKVLDTWDRLKDAIETSAPLVSRADLARARRSGGITSAQRDDMLAALGVPPRSSSEAQKVLDALRRHVLSMEAYNDAKASHALWLVEREAKQQELKRYFNVAPALAQRETQLHECEAYERDIVAYETAMDAYTWKHAELDTKRADVTGWKAAREGLANIRVRIKTHLVPSLSKVASSLLNQMTDGQRSSVLVDEDFNVLVDGQRLETLSGSGKAVANLALRIALGQVLTNRVVSLFIGDEIDASMDDTRAQATHSSVRSLRGSVLQTILVSHKSVEADCVTALPSSGSECRR